MYWILACVLSGSVAMERDATQDGGAWQVVYRFYGTQLPKSPGAKALELTLAGDLSNSAVPGHSVPLAVIASAVWPNEVPATSARLVKLGPCAVRLMLEAPALAADARGVCQCVRFRLEHAHDGYEEIDPLFGRLTVAGHLYGHAFHDVLVLEPSRSRPPLRKGWGVIPEDRRDTTVFHSPPDSLWLSLVAGPSDGYFRFPERKVRYSTKMRLRFRYLAAPGTVGPCWVRLQQYQDTSAAWRSLPDGAFEAELVSISRWTRFEHVFVTEPTATTIALDFRVHDNGVGDLWIDDVELEPLAGARVESP